MKEYIARGKSSHSTHSLNFTHTAQRVLILAQEEALRLQHTSIGTEHLLLGMLREAHSGAASVLCSLGLELEMARTMVEFISERGMHVVFGRINFTPLAKKVLEIAGEEARRFQYNVIMQYPESGSNNTQFGVARTTYLPASPAESVYLDISKRSGDFVIGTEHMLLALLDERDSVAAGILDSLGISVEVVYERIVQALCAM